MLILEVRWLKQREARSLEDHMITKWSPASTSTARRGQGPNMSSAINDEDAPCDLVRSVRGRRQAELRLKGQKSWQTCSTEMHLWLTFQPLVSLVLRYWQTPGLLTKFSCWICNAGQKWAGRSCRVTALPRGLLAAGTLWFVFLMALLSAWWMSALIWK